MAVSSLQPSRQRHKGISPVFRARMLAFLGLARLALLSFCCVAVAHAQEKVNRDYYNPGTSSDEEADWKNAHKFHLQPAYDAIKRGNFSVARENLEFILRVFPNSPQALNGISELCVLKWRSPICDADQWFDKAIAVNP